MGISYLARGTRFLFNGRAFEIVQETNQDVLFVKDLEFTHVQEKFNRFDLLEELRKGNLTISEYGKNTSGDFVKQYNFDDFHTLSEKLQEEAKFRYAAIKPLVGLPVKNMGQHINARIIDLKEKGMKVSRASLYRWLKDYRESNCDIRSLVSSFHMCGPQDKRVSREVEMIIGQVIDEFYLRRESITVQTVHELVYNRIDRENKFRGFDSLLDHPSFSTISRRIMDRDTFEVLKARKGWKSARDKLMPINIWEKPTRPLQRVECDHTRLDLFVVDAEKRLPLGRPHITSLIDVFTGYPLGFYIGFEPASYTSVMHALKHAFFPKSYLKEKYTSVQNEWVAYGIPEMLVVDNGKEFHSKHLEDVCFELKIQLAHCKPRMAWFKGAIERHFGTLNTQLLHQTPGTTFSNILAKGDYNPQKNAVVSFEKFIEMFHLWLIDYYSMTNNRGVRGIPSKLWNDYFSINPHPPVPVNAQLTEITLMKIGEGSIQRYGIQTQCLHYNSPELFEIKHEMEKHGVSKVKFKYDPTNLSKIFVYDEFKRKGYVEVPNTHPEYTIGLNEYTHKLILKLVREKSKVNMSALAETKAKIMEMIEEEKTLTLRQKKQRSRIKGIGTDTELQVPEKQPEQNLEAEKKVPKKKKKEEQNNVVPFHPVPKEISEDFSSSELLDDVDLSQWGSFHAK